ncbi:MAG TPA: PA domain-containing protein, partial [Thermoanaerobaculia bacterium]|nr:PA domain-containing protein [Thermoanaerobaculia bacterium]
SQRGPNLSLVAPGVAVRSTAPVGSGAVADVAIDGELLPEVETLQGTPLGEVTARFVDCGLGKPADFTAAVSGKIALIKRGELTFNEKARNALAAGAAGVIIYNHENSPLSFTLLRNDSLGRPIKDTFPPTVAISMTEGQELLKKPGATVTLVVTAFDYATMQGTSMATPHVAGVAALVWSLAPTASVSQVRQALVTSGRDAGTGGWDSTYGYGVVDAVRAARSLAPQIFGTPARRRTTAH